MSVEEQIARDLELKLHNDIKRAMLHYADMASVADISFSRQMGTICSVLCNGLTQMAIGAGVPEHAALEIIRDQLRRAKQREAAK